MDNEISILLKKARDLQIPAKYVFDDRNLFKEISELIPTGISLSDLYSNYLMLDPKDLALIYARYKPDLVTVNNFYAFLGIKPIRDNQELKLLIQEWTNNYSKEFQDDMEKLDKISILQEELSEYPALPYTPIEVESVLLHSTMKFHGKTPETDDGYEIFDLTKPNITIPYILWNTNLIQNKNYINFIKEKVLKSDLIIIK